MDTQLCVKEVRAATLGGEELGTMALVPRSPEPEVNKDAMVAAMLCLVWPECLSLLEIQIVAHGNRCTVYKA
jgi:hypothetical protein